MLEPLGRALNATGIAFREFAWNDHPEGNYGIYAIDRAAPAIWADGKMTIQPWQGTVDLFAKEDAASGFHSVQNALNGMELSWYLNSVQYEPDTGYIHYEWVWEAE